MDKSLYKVYLILKQYIYKFYILNTSEYYLYINSSYFLFIFKFLKKSMICKYKQLILISVIDWLSRLNRFELYYNLLSIRLNKRIFIVLTLPIYNNYPYGMGIKSLSEFYKSAAWLEREVWDMFGIHFVGHVDLRRILTDYGFLGFPLRKDFPLIGFREIRYDNLLKIIVTEKIKLAQDYRVFNFINPWI